MLQDTQLLDKYNDICKKFQYAVDKANDEIARCGCLEIEVSELRRELQSSYREISKLKKGKK